MFTGTDTATQRYLFNKTTEQAFTVLHLMQSGAMMIAVIYKLATGLGLMHHHLTAKTGDFR